MPPEALQQMDARSKEYEHSISHQLRLFQFQWICLLGRALTAWTSCITVEGLTGWALVHYIYE